MKKHFSKWGIDHVWFLILLTHLVVFSVWCEDGLKQQFGPFNSLCPEKRGRGREGLTHFRHLPSPEFSICHVKLQTCQSPDLLLFYFQGQIVRRGDPTAGEHFPSPAILPTKNPKGRRVKRSDHCPLFTAPPFNPLWTQTLVWAFKHFEAKREACQYTSRWADRATIRASVTYKHSPLWDAANSTEEIFKVWSCYCGSENTSEGVFEYHKLTTSLQLYHHHTEIKKNPTQWPHNEITTASVKYCITLSRNITGALWWFFGRRSGVPAADARTEKSRCAHKAIQCVGWTETPNEIRWCVCRHYLAMTKSALFLFADGGKTSKEGAPQEKYL